VTKEADASIQPDAMASSDHQREGESFDVCGISAQRTATKARFFLTRDSDLGWVDAEEHGFSHWRRRLFEFFYFL